MPSPDDWVPVVDERKHRIGALVWKKGDRFAYEYDFGDGWTHRIVVEAVHGADPRASVPCCTAGRCACPPEDCGGPHGYADLVDAVSDPEHERHAELIEWLGRPLAPESFELEKINKRLAKLARPRRARPRASH